MATTSRTIALGSRPSHRAHLISGGAFASAAIVALSLVVVPPSQDDDARVEVRSIELSAVAYPSPTPPELFAQRLLLDGPAATVVPVGSTLAAPLAAPGDSRLIDALFPGGLTQYVVVALLIPVLVVLIPIGIVAQTVSTLLGLGPLGGSALAAPDDETVVAAKAAPEAQAEPNPVAFVVDNLRLLGEGLGTSVGIAVRALPNLALLPFATGFFSLLTPTQIPTVFSLAAEGLDSFWNGVRYPNGFGNSTNLGYDVVVPGFYIPTDTDPALGGRHAVAYSDVVDGTILPATVQAINKVASNLTAAGVPKVVEQTLLSLEKVTITVQQARVLLRGAMVSTLQNVILEATSGGDVGRALGDGVTAVREAILGDPGADDAHVDPFDDTSATAPSITKLGALGSVATSVKQAVNDVSGSLGAAATRRRNSDALDEEKGSAAKDLVNTTVVAVGHEPGEGRFAARLAGVNKDATGSAADMTRQRPVRDAVRKAAADVKNIVKDLRASVKKAISRGGSDDSTDKDESR